MRNHKVIEVSALKDIPQDILLQIFYKSPVKSLIRFSCVSKLWYALINNDPQFNKFHFIESQRKSVLIFSFTDCFNKRSYCYLGLFGNTYKLRQYKETQTLDSDYGYYNGLVCYYGEISYNGEWVYFTLEICNASKREKLVVVSRIQLKSKGEIVYGFRFGYDLLSNEYKVMCIVRFDDKCEYYIFTLGSTKSWRQINHPWPKQHPKYLCTNSRKKCVPAISYNGTLFYATIKNTAGKERYERSALISFDLHTEKFQMIEFPGDNEFVSDYNKSNLYTLEYKGCLCYSSMKRTHPAYEGIVVGCLCYSSMKRTHPAYEGIVVLHILKDTLERVWVKETIKFVLPRESLDIHAFHPATTGIGNFSNQVILHWRSNNGVIQFYNVHSQELKEVKPHDDCVGDDYNSFNQVENFISLKNLATTKGEGNIRKLWNDYKHKCHLTRDLFNLIPTGNPAVISLLHPS